MFKNGNVDVYENGEDDVYLVTNEKKVINMVKIRQNSCTCIASKNCSHIMACRLYRGENIEPLAKVQTKNLSQLKSNLRGNKSSGRKYRDNIPQSEPEMVCLVCDKEKRFGFPGSFCNCNKFIHNRCKKNHKC